jgi:hypothetical protein
MKPHAYAFLVIISSGACATLLVRTLSDRPLLALLGAAAWALTFGCWVIQRFEKL